MAARYSGVILRRMTTSAEWSDHVAAWRASGLSAEAYCKDKPFSKKSLWVWSSKLKTTSSTQRAAAAAHVPLARIVPRTPVATSPGTASVVFATAKGRLEIHGQVAPEMLQVMLSTLISDSSGGAP